jgi:hypothetical protein
VAATVRTLVYSSPNSGRVLAHFLTLSPKPTADNLTFIDMLIHTAGGTRSLLAADPNERKLMLQILPCLIPPSTLQRR